MNYRWRNPDSGALKRNLRYLVGLTWREECPNFPPESTFEPILALSFILTREVYYSSHKGSLRHRIEKPVRVLCERDIYISHSLLKTYQTHSATDEIKLCGGALNIISTTTNIGTGITELSLRK
jgi:hypothetical protein